MSTEPKSPMFGRTFQYEISMDDIVGGYLKDLHSVEMKIERVARNSFSHLIEEFKEVVKFSGAHLAIHDKECVLDRSNYSDEIKETIAVYNERLELHNQEMEDMEFAYENGFDGNYSDEEDHRHDHW